MIITVIMSNTAFSNDLFSASNCAAAGTNIAQGVKDGNLYVPLSNSIGSNDWSDDIFETKFFSATSRKFHRADYTTAFTSAVHLHYMFMGSRLVPDELYHSALNVVSFIRDKENTVYLMSSTLLDNGSSMISYAEPKEINMDVSLPQAQGTSKSVSIKAITDDWNDMKSMNDMVKECDFGQQDEKIDCVKHAISGYVYKIFIRLMLAMRLLAKSEASVIRAFCHKSKELCETWIPPAFADEVYESYCPTTQFFDIYTKQFKSPSGVWRQFAIYLIKIRTMIAATYEPSLGGLMDSLLFVTYQDHGFALFKHFQAACNVYPYATKILGSLNFTDYRRGLNVLITYAKIRRSESHKSIRFAKIADQNCLPSLSFQENKQLCVIFGWISVKCNLTSDLFSNNVNFKNLDAKVKATALSIALAIQTGENTLSVDDAEGEQAVALVAKMKECQADPRYKAYISGVDGNADNDTVLTEGTVPTIRNTDTTERQKRTATAHDQDQNAAGNSNSESNESETSKSTKNNETAIRMEMDRRKRIMERNQKEKQEANTNHSVNPLANLP